MSSESPVSEHTDAKTDVDRIAELERENQELRAMLEAQTKKLGALTDLLIGEGRSLAEADIEIQEPVLDRLDGQETLAETAMAVATSESNVSEGTKKGAAKRAAKTELVKQCATGSRDNASIDVGEVANLVAPTYDMQYVEAKRVVKELDRDWQCFQFEEGTKKKDGPNDRLKATGSALPPELVRAAMRELANEDLTYRVSSQLLDGGGP